MCGKKPYFPMFIDLSEKRIVIVGGGRVAERRVETLLKFTEDITVISPKVTERLQERVEEAKVRWIPEEVCGEDKAWGDEMKKFLEGADMVPAATSDSTCNERLMHFCRERGICINVSHRKELCDFYFPAVVVKDNVTVGITSGGLDHAQARRVREQIEDILENTGRAPKDGAQEGRTSEDGAPKDRI